jgi:hypothetical protein
MYVDGSADVGSSFRKMTISIITAHFAEKGEETNVEP